jgi:hypothetical protein
MEWVDVKMQAELADAARMLARERDITVGQLMRDLVTREVSNTHKPVRQSERPDSTTSSDLGMLRARVVHDFSEAQTWTDLERRLRDKGYCLITTGGDLVLHGHASGRRLCKLSDLGFSHSKLVRQMGASFPGHPEMRMTRGAQMDRANSKDITADFEVIEPL